MFFSGGIMISIPDHNLIKGSILDVPFVQYFLCFGGGIIFNNLRAIPPGEFQHQSFGD